MDAAALTTRLAEVHDAIMTGLEAARATAGMEPGSVYLGWPSGGRHSRQVWIDEKARVEPVYRVTTARSRQETITVPIKCTADVTGTDFEPARDALLELVAMVEGVVTADPTLGGVAVMTRVSLIEFDGGFSDERTRFVAATVTIAADVRVRPTA